ncbi:MAG: hypothetical protein P9L94_19760 [Candidatus Hinthialibacter antarcticus]|nr:hypothetical protein [Candidatus Hinthialibacter antarcticus]
MGNPSQYFVGWGTLSLINAGLAQSKGRSGLNWFLISLLLGPIATFLLVAFFEPLPPKQTAQTTLNTDNRNPNGGG